MADVSSPEEIASYFAVSRESLAKLGLYVDLLLKWQKRINLIGPSTVGEVWSRHIADGLQLMPLVPSVSRTMMDLGSGSGVPGLVLAIAYGQAREFDVHLVESNGKKAAFLREAIRITGTPAIVHNCRAEQLIASARPPAVDIVMARALAPLPRLLELTEAYFDRGAIGLFHKGQDVDTELTESAKYWSIDHTKHASVAHSRSWILEIREIRRVACL